jgi:hypothetical protein
MKIAAIYWPTSSVGGINSVLVALRRAAEANGDTFDVIRCGNLKTITPSKFAEEQLIRGGDTFLTVHGECSHHPDRIKGTIMWLEANYDALYFAYICPHANKAYGEEPVFMPIYTDVKLPKVTFITDAYWDTYKDWAIPCLPHVKKTLVTQPAYAEPLLKMGLPVKPIDAPIFPQKVISERAKAPLAVWTSQWKNIKGITKLMPIIPKITDIVNMEMYSNGILYYQMRETEEWKAAMGKDHFKGFDGNGKAQFFGYVPLDQIPEVLTRSWFMIDLQGIGNPKFKAYQGGAYNITTIEALLYGSLPILSDQTNRSIIPQEFFVTVKEADEVPDLIKRSFIKAVDRDRVEAARKWVLERHSAENMYREVIEALTGPDPEPVNVEELLKRSAEPEPIPKKEETPAFDMFSMF